MTRLSFYRTITLWAARRYMALVPECQKTIWSPEVLVDMYRTTGK